MVSQSAFEAFLASGKFWDVSAAGPPLDEAMRHGLIGPWAAGVEGGKARLFGLATRFTRMHGLTRRLVAALDAAAIPSVVLKGVTAASWWRQPVFRPQADVDLLVRPTDFAAALRTLTARGLCLHSAPEARTHFHLQLRSADVEDAPVELHDGLSSDFQLGVDVDTLMARRRSISVEGVTFPSLSDADELVFLALHATTHGDTPLRWLFDLTQVGDRGAWQHVVETATEWRVERPVWWALRAARERLSAAIPLSVERALRPPLRVRARLEALERLPISATRRLQLRRLLLLRARDVPGVLIRKAHH